MGNHFDLRIGMKTQQVLSNINRMNTTDTTKQKIINFCNRDHDKKISNVIELTMLQSWANGSDKVPMPKTLTPYDSMKNMQDVKKVAVEGTEPGNKDVLIDIDNDGFADSREVFSTKLGQGNGRKLWLFEDTKLSGDFDNMDYWDLDNL